MGSEYRPHLERAENEIKFSDIIMSISKNKEIQSDIFNISQPDTYFSSVISQSYYTIFYSAKAYLLTKEIKTYPSEEHKKIYEEFKKVIDSGPVNKELLEIYENVIIKAEALLNIFKTEKNKRRHSRYKKLS